MVLTPWRWGCCLLVSNLWGSLIESFPSLFSHAGMLFFNTICSVLAVTAAVGANRASLGDETSIPVPPPPSPLSFPAPPYRLLHLTRAHDDCFHRVTYLHMVCPCGAERSSSRSCVRGSDIPTVANCTSEETVSITGWYQSNCMPCTLHITRQLNTAKYATVYM